MKIPGGGGGLQEGSGRGAGRVSAANWGMRGGGLNIFFSGPKCPPSCTRLRIGPIEIPATQNGNSRKVLARVLAQVLAKRPEGWHRCWQAVFVSVFQRARPASTCASTPASTPSFCQHLCQHPRQHFSGIPSVGSCARSPGSQE